MNLFEDTTIFIFLIPIFVSICVFLSYLKFKRLANPITFMTVWWGGWLFIANFSLTGIYIPGLRTQSLVILMLLAYTLGALVYSKRIKYKNYINFHSLSLSFQKKFTLFLDLGYFILFFAIFPFFIKAINIFRTSGTSGYRRAAFGVEDQVSILYGNKYITFLYLFVIAGILFMFTIISVIVMYSQGKKRYFAFSLILNSFQAVMMLGRFEIYFPIFMLIITEFCFSGKFTNKAIYFLNKVKIKRAKKYIIFSILLLVFIIAIISSIRVGQQEQELHHNILEIIWDFLIRYHTIGFALLNSEIENKYSFLNQQITYGTASLSGIGFLFDIVYNKIFDDRMFSILPELNKNLDKFVEVGKGGLYGNMQLGNAFYTMIYFFYMDGREFAVFILYFILGYLTSYFYTNWIKTSNLYSLAYLLILLYGTLMSIFNYRFSSDFWISLFLVFVFHKLIKLSK
ncbi:MAG: O-antigen polymerase [bacterium]